MAVAYDNDAEATATAATSVTVSSFTVAANSNRCLAVGIGSWDATFGDHVPISSVTWNGSSSGAADVIDRYTNYPTTGGDQNHINIRRILNPTATTASLVVTFPGTVSEMACNVTSLYNVDQTTVNGDSDFSAGANETGLNTGLTVDTTDGDYVYDCAYINTTEGTSVFAAGTDQVERADAEIVDSSYFVASTKPANAATENVSWSTAQTVTGYVHAAAVFLQFAVTGAVLTVTIRNTGKRPRPFAPGIAR